MRGTIVIPQRNRTELTVECVRGLRESDAKDWPIIVVSDGCDGVEREGLVQAMKGDPLTEVILQQARGVTASWNRGAEESETEYLVFLNNDVLCLGEWCEAFLAPVREEKSWISGVKRRKEQELVSLGLEGSGEVFEGWCLGVRRAAWKRLGGFDERLRTYWSDTDFQMRGSRAVQHQEWLRRGLVSELPLIHLGHATLHQRALQEVARREWREDRTRFRRKWRGILREERGGAGEG